MKKNDKIKFAIDNVELIDDNPDSRFALMSMDFFASGDNLHSLFVSEQTLLKTSSSIKNCPVVWEYDAYRDDIGTHSKDETACGFVPESSEIKSYVLDDGRTMLKVIVYIWKNYSGQIIDFFKRDENKKPISVEMSVFDIQKTENGDELLDYQFEAITILGSEVTPAIPLAKGEIVRFSKEYDKDFEREFSNEENDGVQEEINMTDKIKEQEKDNLEDLAFEQEEVLPESSSEEVEEVEEEEFQEEVVDEEIVDEEVEEEESMVEDEPVIEEETPEIENVSEEEFSLNSAQTLNVLRESISTYKYTDEYGSWDKYWVTAYDETYAYFYDCEDGKMYRATYNISGNDVSVGLENREHVISGGYKTVAEYDASRFSKEMTDSILTIFKDYEKYSLIEEELAKEEKDYNKIFSIYNERIVRMSEDRSAYLAKNEELEKFKTDIDQKNFSSAVKLVLKKIEEKVVISPKQLGEMEKKSLEFTLENINEWETMCKAETFSFDKKGEENKKVYATHWKKRSPEKEEKPLWVHK